MTACARMPLLRLHFLLAALLVSACDARRAESPVPPGDSAAVAAVGGDCPTDTTFRHDDPVALAEEFVRRDAEGPMEREDLAREWHRGALLCARSDRADHVEVITTFRVAAGLRRADTAWVHVERTRAYVVDDSAAQPRLVAAPATWTDTVVMRQTRFGWRIARHAPGAHWLPGRALYELPRLSEADRARLRTLVPRPGA